MPFSGAVRKVCVVDGLAYDNPSGSRHAKRWMDVDELLQRNISVLGSINLQFVEEYRERVQAITDKAVTTTVPVNFLQSADEIEVVDAPPEFCIQRAEQSGDPGLRSREGCGSSADPWCMKLCILPGTCR